MRNISNQCMERPFTSAFLKYTDTHIQQRKSDILSIICIKIREQSTTMKYLIIESDRNLPCRINQYNLESLVSYCKQLSIRSHSFKHLSILLTFSMYQLTLTRAMSK